MAGDSLSITATSMDGTSNLAIQYDAPAYAPSYTAAPEREYLPTAAPLAMPRQPLLEGGVMADRSPATSPVDIKRRRIILFAATDRKSVV